ncbi:MAG: carboxyvinyl-carboxyphosphonate phosphorylmutase [Deltaproteobacteria bacterium RBG_13_51_10]|nr:MAG: carboxyvinyl-carboxyphosphonate phosphorylmutase [Deltaproteobacteria bacterium RBG_13_51_10]
MALLRKILQDPEILIAPGAHNAFTAKIIEQAGFKAVYMTGSGAAMDLLGLPDLGFLTMSEMVAHARNIVQATSLPVIADADTGYGNALNVMRTVREYEGAGVAGLHIEDQVAPKRCGHFSGKEVISREEMIGKIKAALDSRRDQNLVVIARTDARAVLGLQEAIERGVAYAEAGADMIFVDAPESAEELSLIARSIPAPLMANLSEGGKTPLLSAQELQDMGYKLVIYPRSAAGAAAKAIQELMAVLKRDGTTEKYLDRIISFEGRNQITGLAYYRELDKKYLRKG